MDTLGVVLIDAGLFCIFLGVLCLIKPLQLLHIRTRKRGVVLAGCGVVMVVIGALLPAPETRVQSVKTRLDEFEPVYQFHEFHSISVDAPKERVYAAVKNVEPDEILFFRTLTWLRRFGRHSPTNILNPSPHQSILDTAVRTGFLLLADDPNREIVFGFIGSQVRVGLPSKPTPDDFKIERPGIGKVAMNFHIAEDRPDHCILTTETRVEVTDASLRRATGAYWRVIYPGSALIRRMWLRAIKRRAEAT